MTTYDYENLFEPEAHDNFRRRDWVMYGAYWLITGKSAQSYLDTVKALKRKLPSVEDVLKDWEI